MAGIQIHVVFRTASDTENIGVSGLVLPFVNSEPRMMANPVTDLVIVEIPGIVFDSQWMELPIVLLDQHRK